MWRDLACLETELVCIFFLIGGAVRPGKFGGAFAAAGNQRVDLLCSFQLGRYPAFFASSAGGFCLLVDTQKTLCC